MTVTIRDLMTDPDLFGDQFGGDSWAAWRALLSGFYGLPLDDAQTELFREVTGGREPAAEPSDELWLAVGRRGGKSQAAALLAVYEAAFRDHTDQLAPGEIASVLVLACDRKQARTVMRYISGLFDANPMLRAMVAADRTDGIELTNRASIEVATASFRSVRGYTVAAVIADEVAFWRSDQTANPDREIINALRPAMATLSGKLVALSSPYARRGELWTTHRKHYGQPGPVLVAQAPSRTMNPSLPQRVIDQAMDRDHAAAQAEYMAEFRSDLEQFISRETVEAVTRSSPAQVPYDRAHTYVAFVDPAGGGNDDFTLSIGHRDGERLIVDQLQARQGIPASIVAEYAELLKAYKVTKVTGDKYAGSWPGDEFGKHGIEYTAASGPKSDLYRDLLPLLTSGGIELPPDERLISQLTALERRTARSGKDSIDHPPGGHDDLANAIAGLASCKTSTYDVFAWFGGEDPEPRRSRPGYSTTMAGHLARLGYL